MRMLAILFLLSVSAPLVLADDAKKQGNANANPRGVIAAIGGTPKIDGEIDEAWKKAPKAKVIKPVSVALGLTLNTEYSNSDKDIDQLANHILNTSDYADKVILICWHHGTIDNLATKLNGTGAMPWNGSVFDRLWLLDYSQHSTPPIQRFGQELLFTDETNVPPKPW